MNPDLSSLQHARILVTGGHGMLSRSFTRKLALLAPEATVWAPPRDELDITQVDQVRDARRFKPDLVLHCGARVDADFCEVEPEAARVSIVQGTQHIVELALETGAQLMYPQSFLVYDGQDNPITERTEPKPLSVYGHMKLEAERLVIERVPGALVVRMAGFFGGYERDNNFVGKVVPHLAKLLAQGTHSLEIGDRVWQPTFTDDLAVNTLALLARRSQGVYCMASHGEASFHDLTVAIVELMGLASRMEVRRIDAATLAGREKARRPLRAVIDNLRLRSEGMDLQRPWRAALGEYLSAPYFRKMF